MSHKRPAPSGGDPDKTGDLSAALSASKPTRRSARGSEVAKQEKKAKRERRAQAAEAEKARAATRRQRIEAAHAHVEATGGIPQGAPASRRGRSSGRGASEASGAGSAPKGLFGGIAGRMGAAASPKKAPDAADRQAFLRYANDNAVVRWFYRLTTGPQRHAFYLVVAALIAVGVYLPVRDFYIANRTAQILTEQKAIRDKYNDSLGKEVKGYMSQEGVEDAARKDLGMVMPGEQTITVEGLDENGDPIVIREGSEGPAASGDPGEPEGGVPGERAAGAEDGGSAAQTPGAGASEAEGAGKLKGKDAADKSKTGSGAHGYDPSKDPRTSAEVEAAERAVLENSPWYWKFLDVVFMFDGANGMAVVSTGE